MASSGRRKVIVTCAVTGAVHVPSQSPYLPLTPEQIADNAIGASEAGAAILHLHARNPEDGKPTPDPDMFLRFLPEIKERCNSVINITTGAGQGMPLEKRVLGAQTLSPEMCSLNMGSMNFGRFPIKNRIKEYRFEWEEDDLESSRDYIFKNTYKDIEFILREVGETHGVRFEFECYDVGHLYNLAYFLDQGLIKPPIFIQTIFGILGGIGPDPEDLLHMRRTANRLFGDDYIWSILGAGRHQFNLVTMGAIMGGNVRVGLEDNVYLNKGELAKNNGEQVAKIVRILNELSLDIATPDEAREMLQLKGVDRVGF